MHYEPALKAIECGYDLLLEKPVAQTAQECTDIANAAKKKGVKVLVGHVLRYTPFYKKVKEIVMSGKIGDIMSVIAVEAVGNLHHSHSYIRLFGTKGELFANASDTEITVYPFDSRENEYITVAETEKSIDGGHGGGDQGIIVELYDYLSGNYTGFCAADIETSVRNHIIGFAAEKARINDTVENVTDFSKEYGFDEYIG